MVLHMLPAAFWTRLKPGDIVLYDEFLRGFPEVYSSLLDIFTSRRAGAYRLPQVLMIGASNSITTYDEALEDRLLHIPVADPRKLLSEKKRLTKMLIEEMGLHPLSQECMEMVQLMDAVVLPTFDVLDTLNNKKSRQVAPRKGKSIRNLVSQVQLRNLVTPELKQLIEENNRCALADSKPQYLVLLGGEKDIERHEPLLQQLVGNTRLTHVQRNNLELNLQLIDLAKARKEKA